MNKKTIITALRGEGTDKGHSLRSQRIENTILFSILNKKE